MMTVGQLIDALSAYDRTLNVVMLDNSAYPFAIEVVEIDTSSPSMEDNDTSGMVLLRPKF
jgi:hypothetical protein